MFSQFYITSKVNINSFLKMLQIFEWLTYMVDKTILY